MDTHEFLRRLWERNGGRGPFVPSAVLRERRGKVVVKPSGVGRAARNATLAGYLRVVADASQVRLPRYEFTELGRRTFSGRGPPAPRR